MHLVERRKIVRHLPTEPLAVSALPPVTSRDEYEAARARLLAREKAHTREGDAIAAERRRLPMIEIPASAPKIPAGQRQWRVDGRPTGAMGCRGRRPLGSTG
jgi:hypothetical protein